MKTHHRERYPSQLLREPQEGASATTGGWIGGHTMRIGAEIAKDIINSFLATISVSTGWTASGSPWVPMGVQLVAWPAPS